MNIKLNRCEHFGVRHAEIAQRLGARPLGEAQIGGVIDDAAGIGVLVIDPHGIAMPAVRRSAPA